MAGCGRVLEVTNSEVLDGVLLGRVSLENVNWNRGVHKTTDSGGLSWQAQEVLQKIKSFNRLPGAGVPLIQLNTRVGSAKTVKKGIAELKSAGLITDTAWGSRCLLIKVTRPQFDPRVFCPSRKGIQINVTFAINDATSSPSTKATTTCMHRRRCGATCSAIWLRLR
jgi:hypothetical protein